MTKKELIEKRTELKQQLSNIINTAETEKRAISEEEATEFDKIECEIRGLDRTLDIMQKAENISSPAPVSENRAENETKVFADYLAGRTSELRSNGQNMTYEANNAVIPKTISNKIIDEIVNLCPIYAKSDSYHVKGIVQIPKWTKSADNDVMVAPAEEFKALSAKAGNFTSVELGGNLFGGLVLIGESLINNADMNVVSFIVNKLAEKASLAIEKCCLSDNGTNGPQGALMSDNTVTSTNSKGITLPDLITLQMAVKQAYQANACWTMHPETFTAIQLLTDSNGRPLIQPDITKDFPYTLLGKPVYLSDNMPKISAGAKCVLYGDYSGLSTNMRENISIKILREKYSDQHAVGIQVWFEFDSKVTNEQKLAVLVAKSS